MDVGDQTRQRMTITLFVAQSFYSAAMIASFTLLPILAAQLSGSDSAAGVPSTINLLGRAAMAYPAGWLMDKVGRRFGLSLGYGLGTVGMMISVWAIMADSFVMFLLGAALFGMSRGSIELGRYVAAEIQRPAWRAKAMGWIVFAGTIGAIAGPALVEPASRWVESWGLLSQTGPFVAGAILVAAGLILIFTLLRPDPAALISNRASSIAEDVPVSGPSTLRLLADRRVSLALASMTIGQLVMTLIMVITPLHMNHQQHGAGQISLVIMAHTLGMFGLSWLTGGLIDRFGTLTMIVAGSIILVSSALLTPLASTVLALAIALFLLGLGWNFCYVAGSALLADSVDENDKGRVQGASEVVVSLASGAGSLGTGLVFASGGMVAVSAIGLAMVLALISGAGWYGWTQRSSVRSRPSAVTDSSGEERWRSR